MLCPLSIVGFEGLIVGEESPWVMVKVGPYGETRLLPPDGVIITLNCSGLFDTSALDVVYVKALLLEATFVYSVLDITAPVTLFETIQL